MPTIVESDITGARAITAIACIVGLGALCIWWIYLGRKRLVQDLPTTKARAVALGLNELVGTVACDQSVPSPQAAVECAFWKNTFYVRDRDDRGWRKTGERTGGAPWFDLVDDTGSIRVMPRNAEFSGHRSYDGSVSAIEHLDPHDTNPTLATRYIARQTSSGKERKVVEEVIPVCSEVYVLGTATLGLDSLEPHIGRNNESNDPFIVRVGTEADVVYRERVGVGIGAIGAFVGFGAAAIAWTDGAALLAGTITAREIDVVPPILALAGTMAAMAVLSVAFAYNALVALRQRVLAAWSLIDVQLRRRHDLLPALVAVVEAHTAHEAVVQQSVAALRSALVDDLPARPSDAVLADTERRIDAEGAAMRRLLALVESYPALTADRSFRNLREQLVDTEDRIALARGFYNNSVQVLHDRAGSFPGNLIAWVFELDLSAEFASGAEPLAHAERGPRTIRFPTGLSPAELMRRRAAEA